MKTLVRSIAAAAFVAAACAHAAGDPSDAGVSPAAPAVPADPAVERYGRATARGDFAEAARIMRDALQREPANAGYHNLYAYALRKGPNPPMDLVFRHYNEALRLDPRHAQAHEYLGEAYLMAGNVQKARDQLLVLERLCGSRCEETALLRKSIAAYEARRR